MNPSSQPISVEEDQSQASPWYYRSEIVPRLKLLAKAPEDSKNLRELSAAFEIHILALAEQGNFPKAWQQLNLAEAFDPDNPSFEVIRVRLEELKSQSGD